MERVNEKILDMNTWKKEHEDYIVRATAADGMIRAFAATTKNLVQEAKDHHNTSPVATAALGRLLTAGAMMGVMLKSKGDLITLTIKGDGPLQGITVTADSEGNVKGFPYNSNVWIPDKYAGKLDVGGAVGAGTLTVVRDQEFGAAYSSQVNLISGEIAEDLTNYFMVSEQVPSSVGLGVLVDTDQSVRRAGGFIIQLMPGCTDAVIDKLEARLQEVKSITAFLEAGMTPEEILEELLGDMDLVMNGAQPTQFYCNCSRERVSKVLVSIGAKELTSMIQDGKPVELDCHFCNKKYTFSVAELEQILANARMERLKSLNILDTEL